MEKRFQLTAPTEPDRKARWEETQTQIKAMDEHIAKLFRYPPVARNKRWKNDLYDSEAKRERLVGRLHTI